MSETKRSVKILVNAHEIATRDRLKAVCEANHARVCPKVRLKDALPLERSGVSDEEYSFALRSHFDFAVTDANWAVLFAVEFDGASHQDVGAKRRDAIKNNLCKQFNLPLLRINANYLIQRFRQWDLLSYLTEVWFMRKWFYDAQSKGHIPGDEPFDPCMIMADGGSTKWPYWFSLPSQIEFQKLHDQEKIAAMAPSELSGEDLEGNRISLPHIQISQDRWGFVKTGMRTQQFPIHTSDVLWQIGVIDLLEEVRKILRGEIQGISAIQLAEILRQFDNTHRSCSLTGLVHDLYIPKKRPPGPDS